MLLDYKGVGSDEVKVESVSALGGLKSEAYLAVNPQGKMPALVGDQKTVVYESDTIARFLGGLYGDRPGPGKFAEEPGTPLALKSDILCRHHDIYLAPLQGALYKASPFGQPYSALGSRRSALLEFTKQLAILEDFIEEMPMPYVLGKEPTQADCALFPTLLFAVKMLPFYEGFEDFAFGPKLSKWWTFMTGGSDEVAVNIAASISSALDTWESKGRWTSILGAGLRDENPPTIFDKIIHKDIPASIVYEDDYCLAFKDINPAAPVHLLLIPKHRNNLTQLQFATDDHAFILGYMMTKVGHIAKQAGLDSYRLVVNDGPSACQSVFHLHLHILGGRDLTWPPG